MKPPTCAVLLDRKMRNLMRFYSTFGFIGVVMSEASAYIALLEEELARRESEDQK